MLKWYEVKEQAAGRKRLMLLWYIYKIAGKRPVQFIVFFVTLFAFLGAPKIRKCSANYLKIATGNGSIIQAFRHFLNFSYMLIDTMEIYTDNFGVKNIYFADEKDRQILFDDFNKRKGVCFLCSHLGNMNAMRTFFKSGTEIDWIKVNMFLEVNQCKIFKNFLASITPDDPINVYPVESIDLTTSMEIKEKLDNGEIIFIAGDRTSAHNSNSVFTSDFLNHKANFPEGAFRFSLALDVPLYFIVCAKEKDGRYSIHLKKFEYTGKRHERLMELEKQYVRFLEDLTKKYPLQFYHFYDFFCDKIDL